MACETALEVQYLGKTVIVTTGTFLKGLMHIGLNQSVRGPGRGGRRNRTFRLAD